MRKKLTQVLGTCLTLAIFVAIVLAHHPVEATGAKKTLLHDDTVSKSIRLIFSQYATSMVGGDLEGWLALWDDEATWLPTDGPASVGKVSIARAFRSSLSRTPVLGMSILVRDVRTQGDIAVAAGEFREATEVSAGGGHAEGNFLTVFRRQRDGSWKIFQSCFNLTAPDATAFPLRT